MQARVNLELNTVWDHYVAAEVAVWDESELVDFQIDCEAGNLFHGTLSPTLISHEFSQTIVAGGRIATLLTKRQELVNISQEHDRIWRQISWLAKLEPVLGSFSKKFTFQKFEPIDTKYHHVLAYIVFELGDYFHSVNLAFPIRHRQQEGDQLEIFFNDFEVLSQKRFKTDHKIMRQMAEQDFEKLVEGRKEASIVVRTGDLIDWFSNEQEQNYVTFHRPD